MKMVALAFLKWFWSQQSLFWFRGGSVCWAELSEVCGYSSATSIPKLEWKESVW